MDQLVCLGVPLAFVYKGSNGGAAGPSRRRAGGVLLLPGVGLPSFFLVGLGLGGGEGGERGKERGGAAPLLVQFGVGGKGARGLPWQPLLFSTLGP